ncbi:MAG: MBL fold metallo-hydrolase [Clostridia bacterium]|nr:MBL fold metallo-hydrolase [Clostridia bacterium]
MVSDITPSHLIGNLYFVGTYAASSHLLVSDEGLMLIDTGYAENAETIVDSIQKLGFNIKDLKYILHSHGHGDHTDATAELVKLTGAKTFLGREDVRYIKGFTPDYFYEDGMTVRLGNTAVRCVFTPGHTEGAYSFFFDVKEGEKTYRCGMFGGAGPNQLKKDYMHRRGVSYLMRGAFFRSIERMKQEHVDVFIGNHCWHNATKEKLACMATADENPFINPDEWMRFLEKSKKKLYTIIAQESRTHFINYAHRGASEYAPENTMMAFYLGLYMGANGIETDVRRTKDGVLVLHHDKTPLRLTGNETPICDLTLAELKALHFEKNGHTDTVVTLEDFLRLLGGLDIRFAIELKAADIEEDVARMIERYGLREKVFVTSFHLEYLCRLKEIAPALRVGWLISDLNEQTVPALLQLGGEEICPRADTVTPELVAAWHALGLNVRAWGVSNEALMRHVYDCGADGMTVNFPDKLTAYIKEQQNEPTP